MKKLIKGSLQLVASQFGPHRYSGKSQLWALMYHRILPTSDPRFALEEPGMVVTPETFRQQLQWLKQLFTILPLSEWIARRDSGQPLPKRACAITFDDGWLDNYEFALPILQQEHVPATLFAVSHMVGTKLEFWPNRVAKLINATPNWQHAPELSWLSQYSGVSADAPVDRERLGRIIAQLKNLPDSELYQQLDLAELALNISPSAAPALANWDQLREMQNSGLVEIGSHTCHHYRLTDQLPADIMEREIVESRQRLEQQLDKSVSLFCYPNGDASPHAVRLVQQHYKGAVTTQRGINSASTPAQQLLRLGVHESISNTRVKFQGRLSGWI